MYVPTGKAVGRSVCQVAGSEHAYGGTRRFPTGVPRRCCFLVGSLLAVLGSIPRKHENPCPKMAQFSSPDSTPKSDLFSDFGKDFQAEK